MDVVVGSIGYRVFVLAAGVVFLLNVEGAEVRWTYHGEVQQGLIGYFFFCMGGCGCLFFIRNQKVFLLYGVPDGIKIDINVSAIFVPAIVVMELTRTKTSEETL